MTFDRSQHRHFASTEQILVAYLSTIPGIGGCSVKLGKSYPFVLVTGIPSGGDNYVTANAVADVEVFHPDRAAAEDFSRLVHHFMLQLRHALVGGVLVDNVTTINRFGWLDYQDATIQRYLASYEIASRISASPL